MGRGAIGGVSRAISSYLSAEEVSELAENVRVHIRVQYNRGDGTYPASMSKNSANGGTGAALSDCGDQARRPASYDRLLLLVFPTRRMITKCSRPKCGRRLTGTHANSRESRVRPSLLVSLVTGQLSSPNLLPTTTVLHASVLCCPRLATDHRA